MKFILFTLSFVLLSAGVVKAQESQIFVDPNSFYYQHPGKQIENLNQQSLPQIKETTLNHIEIAIIHPSYMEPDQFGIRMRAVYLPMGCYQPSQIEYEAKFIEGYYMDVEVKGLRRERIKTQHPTYECDQSQQTVENTIVLNVADIKQKGLKEIRFTNGQARDIYKVTITDNKVILQPQSMLVFKAQGLMGPNNNQLFYDYSGTPVVALHVPMAENHESVANAVRQLASQNALIPTREYDGPDNRNVFYFTDPNGRLMAKLGDQNHIELGEIKVLRPYDGPKGQQGLPIPLKVFITRPGTTL